MKYLIPGVPVPLARPRWSKTLMYDAQKDLKDQVSMILKYQHGTRSLMSGPLEIEISFFMPIAVTLSNKKRDALVGSHHYKRPDLDNLIKFVLDCANGVLFEDDAVIASIIAKKIYAHDARTEFMVRVL